MARLIIQSGGQPEQTVDLGVEPVTIGREAGNTIVLPGETKASRRHCQIAPVDGAGYEVVDLQSTNGTRVQGQAVKRQKLVPGDLIEVGLTKIRFEDPKAAAAREETPSVCYLEFTAGPRRGDRVPLTGARTTLGRRETNTIVLDDRMSSGHHAEIVRDLNGYTVRDLGSTNGTLVNGEPVTETLLTHGSRLRVGNARLVFKDPSMKDVEVALAGIDEDDGGWGMMAELDLEKAGRGGLGGVLALVVLLAVVGGAAFVLLRQDSQTSRVVEGHANLIQDGSFDAPVAAWWTAEEGTPVTVDRTASGGFQKSGGLAVRHDASKGTGPGVARYTDDLEMTKTGTYRLSARVKREGSGRGEVALRWVRLANRGSGSTAVNQTVRLGAASPSWSTVSATVRRPAWAEVGRLVVLADGGATVVLDDASFEPVSAGGGDEAKPLDAGGDADAHLSATGTLDVLRTATVLAVGLAPWAKMPDGRVVGGPGGFAGEWEAAPADATTRAAVGKLTGEGGEEAQAVPVRIEWGRDPAGLTVRVRVEGAAAVGLSADVPTAHLERDGIGVLGSFGNRKLPSDPGQQVDGARKVLAGDAKPVAEWKRPATLLAFESGKGADEIRVETLAAEDPGLVRLRLWMPPDAAPLRFLVSFESERARGREQFRAALAAADRSAAEGIPELRRVAREFPFQTEIATTCLEKAAELEKASWDAQKSLQKALDRFDVLVSEDALAPAEAQAAAVDKQFPEGKAGDDQLGQNARFLVKRAREARWKLDAARAEPELARLAKLAGLLEQESGYAVEAVAYWDAIVRRFGDLAAAPGAEGSALAARVDDARKHRDALLSDPAVGKAYPAVPGK
jgi:pSer/pThr/pTyr-binding forkhead associated (FHA) protein